ncbi:MAG: sugar nucleotide-binding protein, partial [Muribaculaceae bacterium]|nr:sugar nucleotide-binding protein [Muribaculaceae bacterium]
MRRKILLLGAGGQLGRTLVSLFNSEDLTELFEPSAVRHFELDVTSESAVAELINEMHPEIVINATAYTAVDAAEDDIATCFAVNRDAPGYIAKACSTVNAKLLHVSTDYVYNGDIERLHDESESLMPTGVYASSKLEGELRAMQFCENTVVIRTSWLYSPYGKNFVKTIGNLSFTK